MNFLVYFIVNVFFFVNFSEIILNITCLQHFENIEIKNQLLFSQFVYFFNEILKIHYHDILTKILNSI